MGQKASRALAGRLEKGMQKYRGEMEKDILQNIKEKQRDAAAKGTTGGGFTDPNAMDAGFTRGMSAPIRQDEEQEAFLKASQSNTTTAENQELPDDLIQFLQDMGPVERKERKPRLRKHQLEQQQQEELNRLEEEPDEGRQIRDMPIMEDVAKFTTSRTTNFSRRQEEEDKFAVLSGRQLYRLLQDDNKEATVASLVQQNNGNDDEKELYSDLLQNTLKYLKVPVILKDTDDSYVGVPKDKVDDMKKMKLTEVSDSEVRILLSVEDPDENEGGTHVTSSQ